VLDLLSLQKMTSLADDQFFTVEHLNPSVEIKVKGSRFIANVYHVRTKHEAEEKRERLCKSHHDATHNCYAYRITVDAYRYSDDGEPSGTAGKPIYQILENKNIQQVLLIVTRHFGGTKLGTGGLSRAYSDAAKAVLEKARIVVRTLYRTISLQTEYDHMSEVLALIGRFNGVIGKTDYTDKVMISAQIPLSKFNPFQNEINQFIERGIVQIKVTNQ
jgi:uncharacterized YigZ family protein